MRIEPGYVHTLVQLEGSNSPMAQESRYSKFNQASIDTLSTTLIREFVEVQIFQDNLVATRLILEDCNTKVELKEAMLPTIGGLVERMGKHGWYGKVLDIKEQEALVAWKRQGTERTWHHPNICINSLDVRKDWISIHEIYPLNERGEPSLPSKYPNIWAISHQGKMSLRRKINAEM